MKKGDIVKHSKYYLSGLKQANCTKESIRKESKLLFKIVEIPAKHGSKDSIGISPLEKGRIDKTVIIACSKREIYLNKEPK